MDRMVTSEKKKPHVVCIPLPYQSHLKAMLNLAELLYHKGLDITFVNTEFVHQRLLKSGGLHPLEGSNGFRFLTIPDGIHRTSEDDEASQDEFINSIETKILGPFLDLVDKLPTRPVCIIADGFCSPFTVDAAKELSIPLVHYWTISACAFMIIYQTRTLIEKGLAPLKDESYLKNGYLETVIDWIPGMTGIQLKDMSTIVRTTDPNDKLLNYCIKGTQNAHNSSYNLFHTFDALELNVLNALSSMFPKVYTVGPVPLLLTQIPQKEKQPETSSFNRYSLRKEEPECLKWLDSKNPNSVMYVNFGSSTIMSSQDLIEFAFGLANTNHHFLWIIRSDLVGGGSPVLTPELEERVQERGFIGSWCPQEKVLNHPSIGGFLTHCGWGSIFESLSAGVPMICWPYMWDQLPNCRFVCKEWGLGLEMSKDVNREDVMKLVNELMGEEGNELRNKAMFWKEKARIATGTGGSSTLNVNKFVEEISMLSS